MSIENSYDLYNDGVSNVPDGYTVNNAYGAYFVKPKIGEKKIALFVENSSIGYKGVEPPNDGLLIKGNVAIGKTSAEYALDLNGTIRCTTLITESGGSGSGSTAPNIVSTNTELSTTTSTILDTQDGSLEVTLPDAENKGQTITIRLISARAASAVVQCVSGSFILDSSCYSRTLRFDGNFWVTDSTLGTETRTSYFPNDLRFTSSGSPYATAASFGNAVAVSADGLTAVVGAYTENTNIGKAYIFERAAGADTWSLSQTLSPEGLSSTSLFGFSVAMSASGKIIAVGTVFDSAGTVWIYSKTESTWSLLGSKLSPTGNTGNSLFGSSVALSADGSILAVGGYADNSSYGAVWVYSGANTTSRTLIGNKIAPNDGTGSPSIGISIALSADGSTLAFGGSQDDSGVGAFWVYRKVGAEYTSESGVMVPGNHTGSSNIGSALALSADGNTLAVGANQDNSSAGGVWIYTRSGNNCCRAISWQ